MSDTTPALDEAFERMAAASFELPNGFVNHGAMACEVLAHARLRRRHRQLGATWPKKARSAPRRRECASGTCSHVTIYDRVRYCSIASARALAISCWPESAAGSAIRPGRAGPGGIRRERAR